MHHVNHYVKENKKQLKQIFASMGTNNQIQATKVYSFLQSAFDTQEFKLLQNKKSFFSVQENADKMQSLIEEYYLSKNQGETKFYMYRVLFDFKEVIEIVQFWLKKDQTVQVMYKDAPQLEQSSKSGNVQQSSKQVVLDKKDNNQEQQQKSDNEFMPQLSEIPAIIQNYKQQIHKYHQSIQKQQLNQEQIENYKNKITQLQTKIAFLQQRLYQRNIKESSSKKIVLKEKKTKTQGEKPSLTQQGTSLSPTKKKDLSPQKVQSTLKSIFQFYAKQLHVTGVKASFQRIQHQSSRINYQKLVHFLKEYQIFPPESKDQKKLHQFYVKCSSNTRDLTYDGFLALLEKLAEVVVPSQTQKKNKFQVLKQTIIEQRKKSKVLNNPFHSLQREDFRIDKASLKYEFKLMPLNGKDPEQVTSQLQARRQIKKDKKHQKQHTEMQKKIRYIKKLQSIDPFHPIVEKNKHLIRERSVMQSQPIVSMDNLEMFRDKSFDLKMLGIEDDGEVQRHEVVRQESPTRLSGNNSYVIKNRAREIQKLEVQKMRNLMSGIIQRSNAKLQKLGISPTKRSNIY